mmetsp:Transcript_57196/g.157777  ORF Transcript_57196/g.157777 Transcript_57196/m.157777 type:complete len:201 (-) Transcript_57196:55-657(-)
MKRPRSALWHRVHECTTWFLFTKHVCTLSQTDSSPSKWPELPQTEDWRTSIICILTTSSKRGSVSSKRAVVTASTSSDIASWACGKASDMTPKSRRVASAVSAAPVPSALVSSLFTTSRNGATRSRRLMLPNSASEVDRTRLSSEVSLEMIGDAGPPWWLAKRTFWRRTVSSSCTWHSVIRRVAEGVVIMAYNSDSNRIK